MTDLTGVPRDKPIASIFLLPHCQMTCRFCASELGFDLMSFEQASALLAALAAHGFENVVLGGGEPFLWPHDVLALAATARRQGLFVQTTTGGLDLPDRFESSPHVDRWILPLESADPTVHDRLRTGRHLAESHHAVVLARLEALVRAGREITISTVLTRENLEGAPALASLLEDLVRRGARLHAWHLYRFLPVGRGGRPHAAELAIDAAEYRRAALAIQSRDLGFPVYRRDHMLRSRSVEFFWYEKGQLQVGSRRPAES